MNQIRQYQITQVLDEDRYGKLYLAEDVLFERSVLIRVWDRQHLGDADNRARIIKTAEILASQNHSNLVPVYEVGEEPFGIFVVMADQKSKVLKDHFKDQLVAGVEFDRIRAVSMAIQLLNGLACAHQNAVIHGSVNPDHVGYAEGDAVSLFNFVAAQLPGYPESVIDSEDPASLACLSPEQILGQAADHRSDIYSAGALLYIKLTGEIPFEGESSVEILFKKLNETPRRPSEYNRNVHKPLEDAILKAISREPAERWESAAAFSAALEVILNHMKSENALQQQGNTAATQSAVPVDALRDTDKRAALIGRDTEMKRLRTLFHRAADGEGQTVFIKGEAGVGKTSFIRAFESYVKQEDGIFLYGASLYQEGMDIYLSFLDALREFLKSANGRLSIPTMNKIAGIIRDQLPQFDELLQVLPLGAASEPAGSDLEPPRARDMVDGIILLLEEIAPIGPVVLTIDDMQWADEASIALFQEIARGVENHRILLVGLSRTDSYDLRRSGQSDPITEALTQMRAESLCVEILLERHIRKHSDALIDSIFDNALFSEEFYTRIYLETRGNTFILKETLSRLQECRCIYEEEGVWYDDLNGFKIDVPERVEDIFFRRLSAIDEDTRDLLQVASVAGLQFDHKLIARIFEYDSDEALEICRAVESELQLLKENGAFFQFEHPMLRETLYAEIPSSLRKEYHLMIAEEIEDACSGNFGSQSGEAALHFYHADDYQRAFPLLQDAALRSYSIPAYREAASFFEKAIDAGERLDTLQLPEGSQLDLHLKLGICFDETGQWESSLGVLNRLAEIAEKAGEHNFQIEALLRISAIYDRQGKWELALELNQRSLEIADRAGVDSAVNRINNNLGIICFQQGDLAHAQLHFERVVTRTNQQDVVDVRGHALSSLGILTNMQGDHDQAIRFFNKALKIYEKQSQVKFQARVYQNIGITLSDKGELKAAIEAFEHSFKLADLLDDKYLRGLTYLNLGKAHVRERDYERAKSSANKAYRIFKRLNDHLSLAEVYLVLGLASHQKGEDVEADRYLRESIRLNAEKNYAEGLAESCYEYGNFCRHSGNIPSAKEYYLKAAEVYNSIDSVAKIGEISALVKELE